MDSFRKRLLKMAYPDGDKRIALAEQGKCHSCGKVIDMGSFRDAVSLKEYEISGFCQSCQDWIFDKGDYANV